MSRPILPMEMGENEPEREGWVRVTEPLLVGAIHQPLCTYPSDTLALLTRLIMDVHLLRMVAWYVDQIAQSQPDLAATAEYARSEHIRTIGFCAAMRHRDGGTLRVTRAEYDEMCERGMKVEFNHATADAIDFRLTIQQPEKKKRRRRGAQ